MEEIEIWKDIKGAEGFYQVSSFGNVRSLDRMVRRSPTSEYQSLRKGKPLVMSKDKDGYLRGALQVDGKIIYFRVSRLVAETFIPNPENLPEVNHIVPDKTNNKVSNLEWVSGFMNRKHAFENNLMMVADGSSCNCKLTVDQVRDIRDRHATGCVTKAALAREYKLGETTITRIIRRDTYKLVI